LNIASEKPNQLKDVDTLEWIIDEQLKICGDKHSIPFYTIVAKYVPIDLIYQCLSEAKQEGKIKRKLYTKLIKEKAKKYLYKYVKYNDKNPDLIEVNQEEAMNIKYEIEKNIKDKPKQKKDEDTESDAVGDEDPNIE
jgi:hypothetical protein